MRDGYLASEAVRGRYGPVLGLCGLVLALVGLCGCSDLLGEEDDPPRSPPWSLPEGARTSEAHGGTFPVDYGDLQPARSRCFIQRGPVDGCPKGGDR